MERYWQAPITPTQIETAMSIPYRCPICQTSLSVQNKSLACSNGHCFDVSKEGYVNLIPVQNKRSKAPGDSSDMIQARRRFLNAEHYAVFVENIRDAIAAQSDSSPQAMIDIGCGEGWYTNQLQNALKINEVHAIDISKSAVRACAKTYKDILCSVSSAYSLPYFDNSFDLAISVFSPLQATEAQRVLKPGGILVFVGPGPEHLKELAELIYDAFKPHLGNKLDFSCFHKVSDYSAKLNLVLKDREIHDLFAMTPYYWSSTKEKQAEISEMSRLEVTAEFNVSCFKKI
jgi:23S rRNA (guanine745-N1)-methyltransferase